MFKIFDKIEALCNKLILLGAEKLLWLFKLIIPTFIFDFFAKIATIIGNSIKRVVQRVKDFIQLIKQTIQNIKEKIQELIVTLKETPLKTKTTEVLGGMDTFLKKTPASKYSGILSEFISPKIAKFKAYFGNLSPGKIIFFVMIFGVLSVSSLQLYMNSAKIYGQQYPDRKPANFEDRIERPRYYNQEKKMVTITNIKVPLTGTTVSGIQNVILDFSLLCSNRFTRLFIFEHEFELKDHLFIHMEPISPNFSINEEGKRIIKDKVKDEVNIFLKKKNVEGFVKDVSLIGILGT